MFGHTPLSTIGGGGGPTADVEITSFPATSTTSTSASFSFTSLDAAEYSVDGGAFTPSGSPINLVGLSVAAHSIVIRSIASPTIKQGFDWTVVAGGPSVPPVLSNLSPANNTPITPDTALQFEVDHVTGWAIIIPMIILDTNRVPEPTARGIIDADFAFEPLYAQGGSVRTLVSGNKYRYTLRRKGGWTATPRLMLWAVGSDGGVWVGP